MPPGDEDRQSVAVAVPILGVFCPTGIGVAFTEQIECALGKIAGADIVAIHARIFHCAAEGFRHPRIIGMLFCVLENDFGVVVGLRIGLIQDGLFRLRLLALRIA